jgi:hypothetical protein
MSGLLTADVEGFISKWRISRLSASALTTSRKTCLRLDHGVQSASSLFMRSVMIS